MKIIVKLYTELKNKDIDNLVEMEKWEDIHWIEGIPYKIEYI